MYTESDFWAGPTSLLGDQFFQRAKGSGPLGAFDRSLLDALSERGKTDRSASSWVSSICAEFERTTPGDIEGERAIAGLMQAARDEVYPASARLLKELQSASEVGGDDTLRLINRAVVRQLDDDAPSNAESRTFRDDFLSRLEISGSKRSSTWASGVYEVYGEALVLQQLRSRAGEDITITKVPESSRSSPDFKCVWERPAATTLTFYIEVKSLDVVGGGFKLAQDRELAFEGALDIERQLRAGKPIATTIRTLAPFRKVGADPDYEARSLRVMVERIGAKVAAAFEQKQFRDGPTFALANLLRLKHMHHGPRALSPVFKAHLGKVTGAWWTLAFGAEGTPVLREPEFEGESGDDGRFGRTGFLVDPAVALSTAGLMLIFEEDKGKRIVGLKSPRQPYFPGWSETDARAVLDRLCDAWNDRADSRRQKASWA